MKIIKVILILCGIFLFITIFSLMDVQKLFEIFREVNPYFIMISFILLGIEVLIRSWKIKKIIGIKGNVKFNDCLNIYLMGMPFGSVTPGRIGDLVRVYTIKQRSGLSMITSLAIWVIDRFIEVIALVGAASIGIFVFIVHKRLKEDTLYLLIFLACITVFLVFFIANINRQYTKQILKIFYQIIVPKMIQQKFSSNISTFYSEISNILKSKIALFNIFILSLLSWLMIAVRGFVYALALGLKIKLIYFILFIPVINMIEILPISIMGIGTRDYMTILLYSSLGVSKEHGLSLSLMLFSLGLVPQMLVGYCIAWLGKNYRATD